MCATENNGISPEINNLLKIELNCVLDKRVIFFDMAVFYKRNKQRTGNAYNLTMRVEFFYSSTVGIGFDGCRGADYTYFFVFCGFYSRLCRAVDNTDDFKRVVIFNVL